PGLHMSGVLGLRTSSTDAAVGAGLRVPEVGTGHPPRPQWEPQYLSRRPSRCGTTQPRQDIRPRLAAVGSRHYFIVYQNGLYALRFLKNGNVEGTLIGGLSAAFKKGLSQTNSIFDAWTSQRIMQKKG